MASNIKPHQRAFALTIAVIFLVTTLATSVFVVMAIINENKQTSSVNDPLTANQTSQQSTDDSCAIGSETDQPTLPVPEAYKPTADVTALETTDLEQGTGDVVKVGDCLIAKYYGTLATTGEKFDGNFTDPTGLIFTVGTGTVIPGWDQGIVGMKVGGTRRLVIPSDLAYGPNGSGSIPADADLVFIVKVTEIKK